MPNKLLATSYPGGMGSILFAIGWLVLTGSQYIALAACLFINRTGDSTSRKENKALIRKVGIAALVCLGVEVLLVGMDTLPGDAELFWREFPFVLMRATLNLLPILLMPKK